MRNYVVRRLLLIPPIMVGVSFLTFLTFRVIPGSVAEFICGFGCTEKTIAAIKHRYGLDRDIWVQYWDWLSGVVQGDLGESFLTSLPVTTEMGRRLPITVELIVLSLILALLMGIVPGILSAIRPNTPLDWIARFGSIVWLSIPQFYLGILVITFGATWFGWSPPHFATGKVAGPLEDPWANFQTFFPPAFVLSLGSAAVIRRLTRSSMLEVLRNDYIRTAWSKGLKERAVVWRHALKNAMIPVTTIVGLQIGGLIGNTVLVESVFALNGIGTYLLTAILTRDILVVQSLVLLFVSAYVVINLVVDVGYAWLDPRIRYA